MDGDVQLTNSYNSLLQILLNSHKTLTISRKQIQILILTSHKLPSSSASSLKAFDSKVLTFDLNARMLYLNVWLKCLNQMNQMADSDTILKYSTRMHCRVLSTWSCWSSADRPISNRPSILRSSISCRQSAGHRVNFKRLLNFLSSHEFNWILLPSDF